MSWDARIVGQRFDRLSTLHSRDPDFIRAEVLRLLHDHAEADATVWFGLRSGDARPRISDWVLVGDPLLDEAMTVLAADPALWPRESVHDFVAPTRKARESFVRVSQTLPTEKLVGSPVHASVWGPFGLTDQNRVLVVHGSRFIGHVAAYRRGGTFSARESRRLAPAIPGIARALTAADTLERSERAETAYIVCTADGSIEHGSEAAATWLRRPGFREQLQRHVRSTDAGRNDERGALLRGACLRLVRLDGAGVRYLAALAPTPPFAIDPVSDLPPVQRQIAVSAAAGATADEIAAELGRSRNTVKTQLRTIYDRLGIASRAELAALLSSGGRAGRDEPPP